MELEKRIVRIERVSSRMMSVGGNLLAKLTLFTLSAYGFARLVKYLVNTW